MGVTLARYRAAGVFVVLTIAALLFARGRLALESDLLSTLRARDPDLAEVFERSQQSSLFKGKIFVDLPTGAEELDPTAARALERAGYVPTEVGPAFGVEVLPPLALALSVPRAEIEAAVSAEGVAKRADEILGLFLLPGGEAMASLASRDPLGLMPRVAERLSTGVATAVTNASSGASTSAAAPATRVVAYKSPRPMDFDAIGKAYEVLSSVPGARFIGEDFFAWENYSTVQRDILVCTILSLPLNLLLYFLFIRNKRFLAFTLAGNAVSYAWGIFAGTLFFPALYGVALAFTTTFLSFNNEYLVHLSGNSKEHLKGRKLGLLSAIGTTFLGFLVLLFGSSPLVRQLSILSLGGMVGFLAFLWVFRSSLERITFRTFRWKQVSIGTGTLGVLAALVLVGALWSHPGVNTRVREFRSFSPRLEEAIAHFSSKAAGFSGGSSVAVEIAPGEDVSRVMAAARSSGVTGSASPWFFRAPTEEQTANALTLARAGADAIRALAAKLEAGGVGLPLEAGAYAALAPLDAQGYCDALESFSPLRLCARTTSGAFFAFTSSAHRGVVWPAKDDGAARRAWSLEAEPFYDDLLTASSRELGWLFVAGLAAMIVYLWVLHRSFWRLVYILLPVAISAVAVFLWLGATGGALNIIHMLAFALVISLALDYSSVALSSRYDADDLSRVLLTGLSTLAGFGVLAVARHPVLRDLGVVVCLGAGLSLAFALLVRYAPGLPAPDHPPEPEVRDA